MKHPALHDAASASSDASQRWFLSLIRAEYGLLLAISIGYLLLPPTGPTQIMMMLLVIGALGTAVFRSWKKPDEDWYQFRALAESVKTLSWRFSMRAAPFEDDAVARAEFRNHLRELLKVNSALGPKFQHYSAEADQITGEMIAARSSSLESRRSTYERDRITDQRVWYTKKAALNKITGRRWQIVLASIYGVILIVLGIRIAFPGIQTLSPDPLLVAASAIIGWMQVKKYNDLAAAYLLTAQEIGIAATEVAEIKSEESWSAFVIACEQVFSREHTQWVARRAS